MRTLVIQIPCYNEEASLPVALADLPRAVPGFDRVLWLVIDDGSGDRTIEIARAGGVDHVLAMSRHVGLARAYVAGLRRAVELGADIVVNTDADNQYVAADIPALIQPILERRADLVIGARPIAATAHFSPVKKFLQRLGSWVVRRASGTAIEDAPSGFRAMTREVALRLNVFGRYTYTLETIIQAASLGLAVISVPVRTNPDLRPSRLVRSTARYVGRSALTILRIFLVYRPLQAFFLLGLGPNLVGLALFARFLVNWLAGTDRSYAPSLILAATCVVVGGLLWAIGLIGELMAINRRLLEEQRYEQRVAALPPRVIADRTS